MTVMPMIMVMHTMARGVNVHTVDDRDDKDDNNNQTRVAVPVMAGQWWHFGSCLMIFQSWPGSGGILDHA